MYLSNVVVYFKPSAMQDAAHCSVVRWAGLSSASSVGFLGAGGHCPVPIGPLGSSVPFPGPPLVSPCGLLMLGGGLHPRMLAGPLALPLPSPPLPSPLLMSSSSLGPPGGDDDGCECFDAGFRISNAISALFHST